MSQIIRGLFSVKVTFRCKKLKIWLRDRNSPGWVDSGGQLQWLKMPLIPSSFCFPLQLHVIFHLSSWLQDGCCISVPRFKSQSRRKRKGGNPEWISFESEKQKLFLKPSARSVSHSCYQLAGSWGNKHFFFPKLVNCC